MLDRVTVGAGGRTRVVRERLDLGQLNGQLVECRVDTGDSVERGERLRDAIHRSAFAPQCFGRFRRGLGELLCMLQGGQSRLELLVLAGLRRDAVDLFGDESKVVGVAGRALETLPQSRVIRDRLSVCTEGRRVEVACLLDAGSRPPVEVPEMARRAQKRLMLVLTVEVDQRPDPLREGRDRSHLAIDRATAPSVGAGASASEQLHPVERESSLNERFAGATSHRPRVGPLSKKQLQRAQERGLAGAGFSREHGHARPELEPRLLDEREIAYVQLFEHPINLRRTLRRRSRRSRARRA